MPRFELDVNVKSGTSGGRGGVTRGQSRAGIREGMQQAAAAKRTRAQLARKDPQARAGQNLTLSMQRLDRTVTKLDKTMARVGADMKAAARGMARGGGGGGGGGGLFGRGGGLRGGAGGMGRMGAAVPVLGAVIGAFAYAVSKVLEVGRAHIAKVTEQRGTAGVAGLRGNLGQGVFTAAEYGRYVKERRMAAGRFEETELQGKGVSAVGQMGMGRQTTAIFGQEAGASRLEGLLSVSARGRGEKGANLGVREFNEMMMRTFTGAGNKTRDIGTEVPIMIREISSKMEEAVREGVNGSDMAKDMASELTQLARVTPGGQIRSAIQTQKSMMGIQQQAAMGQGGTGAWRMNVAARGLLTQKGEKGKGAALRKRLMGTGLLTGEQQKILEEGGQLPPEQMQFLMQAAQGEQSGLVREQFLKETVKTLGGTGKREQRLARFHRISQQMLPEMKMTPQRSAQLFEHIERKNAAEKYNSLLDESSGIDKQVIEMHKTGKFKTKEGRDKYKKLMARKGDLRGDIAIAGARTLETRGETGMEYKTVKEIAESMKQSGREDIMAKQRGRMKMGAGVRGTFQIEQARETMLMGGTAASAAKVVASVERSMINLAGQMAGPVNTGIRTLNSGIIVLGKAAAAAIPKVIELVDALGGGGSLLKGVLGGVMGPGAMKGFGLIKTKLMGD